MLHRLAVFISGSGSNLQSIIDAEKQGDLGATIALILSNKEDAYGLVRAKKAGIPTVVLKCKDYESLDAYGEALIQTLREYAIDVVALAGFLTILPENVIAAYPDAILNIHPALLPKFGGEGFYGIRVHESVLAAKEKESGPTVHLVTEVCDGGRILAQEKVEVKEDDTPETLQARVLEVEHRLYPKTIRAYLRGDL